MADESIRRSGRATKGQHTKDREPSEEATSKRKVKKGKGGRKAAQDDDEEDEENAYVRCVCGIYEEEEEVERSMICCDNCSAWQHNDCMSLPDDPNYSPETYYCEQCKPEDHKELLAAIERGEKPWEEAARKREAAAALKPKKGKRGRKSAASRASQDVEDGTPARSGQKRKVEDETPAPEVKGSKKARSSAVSQNGTRKSSSAQPEYDSTPVAASVAELNNGTRKTVANQLVKAFVEHTQSAIKQGAYSLPRGTSAEQSGTRLGLLVEHAMYAVHCKGSGDPTEAYKSQMRTISYNVKKNIQLRNRVLNGEISAQRLASMDAQEMASDEQQKKDAAMKKELEKQHTIVQDQAPRIRRTHKGEEYVDESHQVAAESTKSHAPVRRSSGIDGEETRSPEAMSPRETAQAGRPTSQGRPKPSIDTKRKSSANFNIDNVWSTVQGSPDAAQQRFPELQPHEPTVREHAGPGTGADADIDALLKDEDAESVPYSPKDYEATDGTIWQGVVNGGALGRFHCTAKYAAGCSVDSLHMTYHDLIPTEIGISGRIDPTKADEYLCGLQYSQSSDVIVVSIAMPHDPIGAEQFTKLFQYFKSRSRYGVGTQHRNAAIKDIYLIPLDVGDTLPGLLNLLENKFSSPVGEKMFMLPFVIKNTELPYNAANRDTSAAAPPTPIQHTPVTPYDGLGSQGGPHDFPPHPSLPYHQSSNGTPTPATLPPGAPPYQHPPYPQQQGPPPAAIAAQQVLGPELSRAPAVLQLVAQAPNAGLEEMTVVRDCIAEDPRAAHDLSVLTNALQMRYQLQQGAPGAATGGSEAVSNAGAPPVEREA